MTIFEQYNEFNSMCILSSYIVDEILKKHNIFNDGFESMHVDDEIQNLSLLFYLHFNSQHSINKYFFIMQNMTKQLHKNKVCHEKLIVQSNGLQDNTKNITLEISLFPFLFPHGHGVYDGKIKIHEHLNFRMSSSFSPSTLYKPYLLIMYDI
jgi:hypothetical protein